MPQSNSAAGEARFPAAGPMLGRDDAVAGSGPQDYAVRGIAKAPPEQAGEPKQSCRPQAAHAWMGDRDSEVDGARSGRRRE